MKKCFMLITAVYCSSLPLLLSAQKQSDSSAIEAKSNQPNRVHKVVKGETLYKIAKQYGCTVDEIKKLNKNTEPLMIGARLNIPAAKTATSKTAAIPEKVPPPVKTPVVVKEEKKIEKPNENVKVHTVVSGETLSKIALKYGTTVVELKALNKLTSDGLRIGQKLSVPDKSEPKQEVVKQVDTATKSDNSSNKTGVASNPAKQTSKINVDQKKENDPGIPEKSTVQKQVITENIMEKEEVGKARVVKGKMDDTRTYAMHPSIPKGNIVVVIHPSSGRMAYCKIIDNYTPKQYEDSGIVITPAVAQKIGISGSYADVKIKYAAP